MANQANFYTATLSRSLSNGGSDTEVFVSSIQTPDGQTLSTADFSTLGAGYLTLDPQSSARVERIKFTGVSSADISFTGCTRGLLFIGGSGSSSTNAHYHPVGAAVVISFGADDLNDIIAYVNSVAIAGAPNATTSVKGISQLPTQAQVDAKTASGSTGASLVVTPATLRSTLLSDYVVDTGTANAYAIAPSPAITAYTVGQVFSFKAVNANTTVSTVNVNGLGTKNIFIKGAALVGGEITAGQIVVVEYDGTQFQMVSPPANYLSSTAVSSTINFSSLAGESITAGNALAVGYYQSDGGIKFDATAKHEQASGTSLSATITIGSNSNRILIAVVACKSATTIGTVVANGTTIMTVLDNANISNTNISQATIAYMLAPPTGSVTVVATLPSVASSIALYSYYNVAQSSTFDNHNMATDTTGGTLTETYTPNVAGALVFGYSLPVGLVSTTAALQNNKTTFSTNFGNGTPAAGDTGINPVLDVQTLSYVGSSAVNPALVYGYAALAPVTAPSYGYVIKASSGVASGYATPLSSTYRLNFIGFAVGSASATQAITVTTNGVVTGLSGVKPMELHYLSDTAGSISTTAGTTTRKIGLGLTSTTLLVTNEP